MNLVKNFKHNGFEVHTIAPNDKWTKLLVNEGCLHHNVNLDSRSLNPIKDLLFFLELLYIYFKVRPKIVLHFTVKPNIYGTIAARILNIPTINNVCGLGTVFLKNNLVSFIGTQLYKLTFRYPKRVFFQNVDDSNLFISRKLISKDISEIIPGSGIDLNKFSPAKFSRNGTFTFLLISRLIRDKGILEYIEAIRLVKSLGYSARFQILGPKDSNRKLGIDSKKLDAWTQTGIVEYLGTTEDVRPYIKGADCIVLPSYREGTPRVLLEAACCAKPIIATNVPGCKDVVLDNHNGYLCAPKDAFSLAERMISMICLDDQKLKTFGDNGRRKMEAEYGDSRVTAQYHQAINKVLSWGTNTQ